MRLIVADEVLTKIQKAYVDTDLGTNKRAIAINIGLTKALNIVQDCKKIERKTGKWIHDDPKDAIEAIFLARPKCSECGFEIAYETHFCPNCGARMEGIDETD